MNAPKHFRLADGLTALKALRGRPCDELYDCAVRAFTIASGATYEQMHQRFKNAGRRSKCRTPNSLSRKIAQQLGYTRVECAMRLDKFIKDAAHVSTLIAFVRGHCFVLKKGAIVDIEPINERQIVKWYYLIPAGTELTAAEERGPKSGR